ncbi:MAG TPA: chromate transporter, partial [Flavisolibacter sp.]
VVIGIAALVLALIGWNEIILMFGAGVTGMLLMLVKSNRTNVLNIFPFTFLQAVNQGMVSVDNTRLFFIFLKIGAILYGSGYVLFAFLDTELVAKGIINRQELMDAIAVGQFTPGPVFSSVTFIGYLVNGWSGAAVSTLGIFLPSFVFVALLNPLVKKMRKSVIFSSFLDAVNVASVALITAVCFQMGKDTITDWRTITIAILAIVTAFVFKKINSALIVLGGSLLGYLLYQI